MMSILGCSAGELGNVLKALGFWAERRKLLPAPADAIAPQAATPATGANGSGAAPAPASPAEAAREGQASEPASDAGAEPDGVAAPADAAPGVAPAEPAASQDRPGGALKTPEEHWEEVWRPRRKGRTFETASERHGQQRARQPDKAPAHEVHPKPGSPGGKPRGKRPDRRRGGDRERSRPHLHASPPPSKATFDPDSPFAALSSLKAQMEKRSQD
jgi:ATP-dependent RNA helicase SUPV3L1/SUV3